MSKELIHLIDLIGREKGLDREVVIKALEEALSSAVKKRQGTTLEIHTVIDRDTGEFRVWAEKRAAADVVNRVEEISVPEARTWDTAAEEGSIVRVPLDMEYLGRIAAQIAKQVIHQKVREAERDMIHTGYKDRQGELITGRVHHRDRGDLVIDLGKVEALLPKNQQIPHESFRVGDHVRAWIMEVQRASRGPQIILSRTAPEFLRRLFELEVPEIGEGVVDIRNVVREPGERAKVAVASTQREVDPVGACVGVKGSRVQAIVRELRGEKIDIIEWSDDVATMVKNALSPAVIEEIRINKGQKHIMVIVPDEELSQAIGKKGQNVRLASRLIDWEIDLTSRTKMEQEALEREQAVMRQALADSLGIPIGAAAALISSGHGTPEDVRSLGAEELAQIDGLDEESVALIREAAGRGGRSRERE